MKKNLLILALMCCCQLGLSQVGINTTTPNAQLEIKASNQAAPSNKDGILIPKIDAFPVVNPTAAQQGMMVYLTTVSAGKQPGFYYWDSTGTPQWKSISGTIPNGTATGNTMYWNGTEWVNNSNFLYNDGNNVGINTSTPSSVLTVKKDQVGFTQEDVTGASRIGFYTNSINAWVQTHSNTDLSFTTNNGSTQMVLQKGTGNVGIGTIVPTTKLQVETTTGGSAISGRYVSPSNGAFNSVFNAFLSPTATMSTGKLFGLKNDLTTMNSVEFSGVQNGITGAGTGNQYGMNNQFTSTANAERYGMYNSFNATAATNYGVYNDLLGTGIKYGSYNEFTNGNGAAYGVYNKFRGSGNATRYGNYTEFWDNGSGDWFGNYVYFEYMSSSGASGNKYGYFVSIPVAVGGSEIYGVCSEVGNLTNGYSGYFSGRVSIGDSYHPSTHYIMPLTRGTNGQIMQTDGSGNVTWQNPQTALGGNFWSTAGNSATAASFLGTTNNFDLVFKRNNVRSGLAGVTNTSFGVTALNTAVTGANNSAFGANALQANAAGNYNTGLGTSALYSNTSGNYNTASGYNSLWYNTSGQQNTGYGVQSLFKNSTGQFNTATGTNALYENTTGNYNTANGHSALYSNTTGDYNTAIGLNSLNANTTGTQNSGFGVQSLFKNTIGMYNTATGTNTLYENTTGNYNTANGHSALHLNVSGSNNVANGYQALYYNRTGDGNIASGYQSLYNNNSGYQNIALGARALYKNVNGWENVAIGTYALNNNVQGYNNVAVGLLALQDNISGINNVSIGNRSLFLSTTGSENTAVGTYALGGNTTAFQNTAFGYEALPITKTGSYNTALGYNTGPNNDTFFNTTCLGIDATATASNSVRIGNTFVTSIGGYQGWTTISDGRIKEEIREDVPGLDFIKQLRPVTYRLNRDKINQMTGVNHRKTDKLKSLSGDKYSEVTTGFIAQEVEQAAKKSHFDFNGVDAPKNENDFYGLRYEAFVVPLVKAVQEQQQMIEIQNKAIELQTEKIKQLETVNEAILKRLEKLENK